VELPFRRPDRATAGRTLDPLARRLADAISRIAGTRTEPASIASPSGCGGLGRRERGAGHGGNLSRGHDPGRRKARRDEPQRLTEIEVDLTEALEGRRALHARGDRARPDDRDYRRESFGRALAEADWYGIHGGIWKPARLEARNPLYLHSVAIQASTNLQSHAVRVKGALSFVTRTIVRIALSRAGAVVAQQDFAVDTKTFDLSLAVAEVDLWSPEAPSLYEVAASLVADNTIVDAVARSVGFRRLEARDSRLLLNGRPFYMFGALDQDWYPEEDAASLRGVSGTAVPQRQGDGLNTLRCHVKIPTGSISNWPTGSG